MRETSRWRVCHVIADFGQARGTNTATILPNDPLFARRYGRTILLRGNIIEHPDIVAGDLASGGRAAKSHADDLASEGDFQRTLWHEVGHYLGVDRDVQGRTLDTALQQYSAALEEMKADLVSLFALDAMHRRETITPETLRAVQAAGIRRVLLNVKPRADQPYQTMELAQFNYFLDQGLLLFDGASGQSPSTTTGTPRWSHHCSERCWRCMMLATRRQPDGSSIGGRPDAGRAGAAGGANP